MSPQPITHAYLLYTADASLPGCGWSSVSASKQTQGGVRSQGFVRVFIRAVHLCANALLMLLHIPTVILFIEKQVCLGFWRLLPPSAFWDIHGPFSCRIPSKKKKEKHSHQTSKHLYPLKSTSRLLFTELKVDTDECPNIVIKRASLTFSSVFPGKWLWPNNPGHQYTVNLSHHFCGSYCPHSDFY